MAAVSSMATVIIPARGRQHAVRSMPMLRAMAVEDRAVDRKGKVLHQVSGGGP
jgi:hypothetical protein